MTVKEFIEDQQAGVLLNDYSLTDMIWFMDNYAKHVLGIAAEKAEIGMKKKLRYGKYRKWQKVKEDEVDLFAYEVQYFVEKDSILNCLK